MHINILNNLFNLSMLCCSLSESYICTTDEGEVLLTSFQTREYQFCFVAKYYFLSMEKAVLTQAWKGWM